MENLNTFWKKNRDRKPIEPGESKTVPGCSLNISDLIKQGKISEAEKESKKRMIYGNRVKLEDLTKLDYFSNILTKHKNLIRTRELQEKEIETQNNDKVSNLDKINRKKQSVSDELELLSK